MTMPASDDVAREPSASSTTTDPAAATAACPFCGTRRSGRSAYCEECGAELPRQGAPSAASRGLTVLFVVVWTVLLVGVLFWLTGHMLLLK